MACPECKIPSADRQNADDRVMPSDASDRVVVHSHGLCESDRIGAGTRIWAFAHVLPGATVGRDCNICDHTYVEGGVTIGDRVTVKNGVLLFDGVTIEDDAFVGPSVIFTNDLRPRATVKRGADELLPTLVRVGATLGAGVVVVCGLTIGAHAFVGAGTVVTRDVPAYGFVVGNPGRLIGWACECGRRLGDDLACECGHTFREEPDGLVRVR
jgi:UDP-2-acetamido-3-amino-2,3-dideoxy-glucuronate N-acetyltransferase